MSISVVVPTYNRADLLPATINSILAQTLPPREILIVDDGSYDNTSAILERYAPQVRVIRIDNSGDMVARNTGVRAASGELIAFCDSDDLWAPDFLDCMASLWRAEPNTKAAYSDFVLVRNGIWEHEKKFDTAPPGFWVGLRCVGPDMGVFDQSVVERIIHFQPFFPSAMVVNREFFLSIGGWDEAASRIIGCDFATVLRVGEHPPIGVVRRPLVGIRKHAGNISGDVEAMNLGDARILEHVLANRPSVAAYRSLIEQSVITRRRHAFDAAFARGDFAGARSTYSLVPHSGRSRSMRLKYLVACCPTGIGHVAARCLIATRSLFGNRK